jgi:3-phenylpropionate/trans-cinnamate dioxygenase ferredoxin reductase subunit
MAKSCLIAVNGKTFKAKTGELLLDAALVSGVHIPHDCRAGTCGTCLTRIVKGATILGESAVPGMVYACQARILSDLEIEAEKVPEPSFANGRVWSIQPLASDVVEVTIQPERHLFHLPGQYFKFKFDGFPPRAYSAAPPLDWRPLGRGFTLQIRREEEGLVSSQFGNRIRAGHAVGIEGPYGGAFFRRGKAGRLVLVSSGTGFAPIWSIACAALHENPFRHILLVVGLRTADPIYMAAALEKVARFANVDVIVTIGRRPSLSSAVSEGYPSDHLQSLSEEDIVYACGPAHLIDAVTPIVVESKAQFYSDPFDPAPADETFLDSAKKLLTQMRERLGSMYPGPVADVGTEAEEPAADLA